MNFNVWKSGEVSTSQMIENTEADDTVRRLEQHCCFPLPFYLVCKINEYLEFLDF